MSGLFRSVRVGWRGKGAVPTTPSLSSPVLSIAPVITGTTQVGQTLSVSTGTWLNSPTGFSYQWYRGATPVGTNAAAYTLVVGDIGSTMNCVVTAANGSGATNAATSSVGPVIDLAPANSVLPAITGTPTLGQTLSVSNGTWVHTPTGYAYQWNRAGSPITSANAATYLLVGADVGTTITCTVTATNSGGSTPATSASVGPVGSGSSSLTISTAPTLSGDAVVGQTIFATNGTYSATPDSYTPTWSVGGVVQSDQAGTTLLVLDQYAGLAIGYSEVAHKAAYTDSASNAATSTGAVANISLASAITAFTRTSTSGTVPMTWSVTFAANVYEGYFLRAQVFSDSGLSTQTQDIHHVLTHADLQPSATINLTADGLTTIGATSWLQLTVYTTSPNGAGFSFTYPTALSPTDAVVAMVWNAGDAGPGFTLAGSNLDATATSGVYGMIRSNRSKATGKWYYEVKVEATGNLPQIGWANATASLTNFLGADTNGVSFFGNGNFFYNGGNVGGPGVSWAVNDIIQCCIDKGTDTVWFGRNNVFTGSPSGGTGGISVTGIGTVFAAFDAKSGEVLAQFTSASQTYTPPTGFTAIG